MVPVRIARASICCVLYAPRNWDDLIFFQFVSVCRPVCREGLPDPIIIQQRNEAITASARTPRSLVTTDNLLLVHKLIDLLLLHFA